MSGYPGYPGAQQGYPGAQQGYPGAQQGYPGAQQGYPGAQQGYPGAQQGYPGAQQGYPGAQQGYPGAQQGYPGAQQGYRGPQPGYPGAQQSCPPAQTHTQPPGGYAGFAQQKPPTQQLGNLQLSQTASQQNTGAKGQIPVEPKTQGTVRDVSPFDAEKDSEILRKAMKGLGTDEKAITAVLGNRSNKQRQQIKKQFTQMFGKDLIKELKSELGGNYETIVLALLMPITDYDAYCLYHAIEGVGTDDECLIEILCSRSNAEIRDIVAAYKRMYKRDLEKDLSDDTSGNFKRLLVSLCQGARMENAPLDHQKAAQDAHALFEAGEARWGTDESRFNVILASRSYSQLRLIFKEYERLSKHTLEKAVKKEMSGEVETGMVSVIRCAENKPKFFANQLYHSMKGMGTDDTTLIRIMVSRSEIDMVQIKQEFQGMHGKTLEHSIKDDCSGDYKKLLMQLCN